MRIFAFVSLAAAYTEPSRCGFDNVPMVYMNLDSQVERRMRFTEMFPDATRIRSVNGRNVTELLSRLDYDLDPDEFTGAATKLVDATQKYFRAFPGEIAGAATKLVDATQKYFRAFPGEIGCVLTMLDSFKYGIEQNYEYMIVAEDDVAVPLCGMLPSTLDRVINQLNEADPDWEVLRLQWSVPVERLHKMKMSQFNRLRELINELGDDYRQLLLTTYGAWENAPILGRFRGGWGNVFNVWHRRGMQRLVQKYGGKSVNGIQTWRCPDNKDCISDAIFVVESPGHSYAMLPPWAQNEPGERGSMIREGKTNHHFHLSVVAQSTQWLIELREFIRRGAQDLYPDPDLVWQSYEIHK